ncbi:hypothetical protein C8F01DRAFT_1337638 [Mycena amicta]|nr:hypothetical protein C8F01DRAFT_1337638 [Mycena amicta]
MSVPAFDPNPTLGAILIGTLLSTILFGVTTAQAYLYSTRFPEDSPRIKATVALVWICEAAHVGCVSHTLYTWLVTDYAHPERLLGRAPGSMPAFVLLTVIIAVCVQVFFSYRIYVLSRSRIIPYFTFALSFVRMGLGLAIFSLTLQTSSLAELSAKYQWLLLTMWSLSAVEDITITTSLVYLLWVQRKKVHKQTTAFLDKLIMWTIETGVVTSMFTVVMLICFHVMPHNLIWLGLFTIEARLFANSLFARQVIEEGDEAAFKARHYNKLNQWLRCYSSRSASLPRWRISPHRLLTHSHDVAIPLNPQHLRARVASVEVIVPDLSLPRYKPYSDLSLVRTNVSTRLNHQH